MTQEQMEKITFANGEMNALFRQMGVNVGRVKARQNGSQTVVIVERFGKDFQFDASDMTLKQMVVYVLARV